MPLDCCRHWKVGFCVLMCFLPNLRSNAESAVETIAKPTEIEEHAAALINEAAIRGHVRFLADDLLEGRGPGTRGDQIAQRYLSTQFQSLGLKPAAPDGSWYQPVPLRGVTTHLPESITFSAGSDSLTLKYHDDYIATSGTPAAKVSFQDAELVFVGYGIVAPEYDWNDYKGLDLKGKILVMMNNDPSHDPELFAGSRRLYYGRWDYKYEMAAQQGAVGAIIIHTTESAGYPFQVVQTSWKGEESELRSKSGPRLKMRGWVTNDAAKKLCQLGGHDLDQLRGSAQQREFKPVLLGSKLSIEMTCDVREQETANVLGKLEGSDPDLKREYVVFMAHHDHIGIATEPDASGDRIYNGAVDNATGSAGLLAIARAFQALPQQKRSILFAAVGAEEQGLLGSQHMAAHPPVPAGYLAAVINIDGLNIFGRTRDVNAIGFGKSSLDEILKAAASWQNRYVIPDRFPDRGFYYRSDQFSLAKVGVPGIYLHGGTEMVDKPSNYGRQMREDWEATKYHQPSDEYSDNWDLGGAIEDARLLFYVGLRCSQQKEMPSWKPGDEFEAARKAAIRDR